VWCFEGSCWGWVRDKDVDRRKKIGFLSILTRMAQEASDLRQRQTKPKGGDGDAFTSAPVVKDDKGSADGAGGGFPAAIFDAPPRIPKSEMVKVTIISKQPLQPPVCCSCARKGADEKFVASHSQETGIRGISKKDVREFEFPICSSCNAWVVLQKRAETEKASLGDARLVFVGLVIVVGIVAKQDIDDLTQGKPIQMWSAAVSAGCVLAVVLFIMGMLDMRTRSRWAQAAANRALPDFPGIRTSAPIVLAKFTRKHLLTFYFANKEFAELFRKENAKKFDVRCEAGADNLCVVS